MKNLLALLLIGCSLSIGSPANAQSKPKKAKRAFAHNAENGQGRTNKAQFRRPNRVNRGPIIDLGQGKSERFKTAKANPPYKFPNPHR